MKNVICSAADQAGAQYSHELSESRACDEIDSGVL
jgi:hypothetical protein